ncbi:hypothetical protein DSO57_1029826 [Entomophthora muscae]|uniref:Uncharacterized protein n=1 Tax=Entomophthora muscae TaxID=34485 RepID=A0ACC2UB00_9FUNG|nr:hypothetical protein DSO57_1029826 [Entomophthora muscae]
MSLLEDLDSAILVSKDLVDRALTSKLYKNLTEKLSRKIKRGLGILGDLKSVQEGPNSGLCSKHFHSVVKNYLSVTKSAMDLINSYDEKPIYSKYFNSDAHKKELYGLLNDVEQAIHELDTEACLHERLVFEKFKASMNIEETCMPTVIDESILQTNSQEASDPIETIPLVEQVFAQEPESHTTVAHETTSEVVANSTLLPMPVSAVENDVLTKLSQVTLEKPKPKRQFSQNAIELNKFIKEYCIPRSKLYIQSHSEPHIHQYCKIQKHCIQFSSQIKDIIDEKTYCSKRPEVLSLFLQEVTNLHQLQGSPYIVRFYGLTQSISSPNEYMMYSSLLETTSKGTVYEVVQNQSLSFGHTLGLMEDVAHGLVYLHNTHKYVHCNLNANNVLITAADRAKITGFEFASSISEITLKPNPLAVLFPDGLENTSTNHDLAMNWLDPCFAANQNQQFSPKNDIYSYGMLFWFMFSRTIPFKNKSCAEILSSLKRGEKEDIFKVPQQYHSLLHSCWETNLSARPEAKALLGLLSEPVHEVHDFQQLHLQPGFFPAPNPMHAINPQFYPHMGFVAPNRNQQMNHQPHEYGQMNPQPPASFFYPSLPHVPGQSIYPPVPFKHPNHHHIQPPVHGNTPSLPPLPCPKLPSQGNLPSFPHHISSPQSGYAHPSPHTGKIFFPVASNSYHSPPPYPPGAKPSFPVSQPNYKPGHAPPLPPHKK